MAAVLYFMVGPRTPLNGTLLNRIGLTVNEQKTRLVKVPEENFNFLGYTLGRFYRKAGRPYLGTRPSRKAISLVLARISTRRRYEGGTKTRLRNG